MAAIPRKSRPKSLTKRSMATSILPKLYRQFSKNGVDHHEAIGVSISSTNELITSAFKDLKIGSKSQSTTIENGHQDVVANSLCEERIGERCILTEEVSEERSPLMGGRGEPCLQSPILEGEGCSADCCGKKALLKTPLSVQELNLVGKKNISSSSIDSGVYSLRGSKRPSFEQASPVDPLQSNQGMHAMQRSRTLSGIRSIPTVSVEDIATRKGVPRLSVGEEAFSELLEAAKKLVLDAHPIDESVKAGRPSNNLYLENSLQYCKRRKSEWDITRLKPQHEKVARKKSAEPILQRIPTRTSNAESNSRRVSACIICERNKRVSENVACSVLIKTTMVRTMQARRRFSEVLKVYKPGDLPYTEFVLPKICELKTPSEPRKDAQGTLKDLVDDNMPTFVRLTNWNSLYAHLVSKRLLDAYMREFMLSASVTNQEKGNKFYGEYLPSHGMSGYQRLLQCYQEECDHTGHETLANLLQGHIKSIVT